MRTRQLQANVAVALRRATLADKQVPAYERAVFKVLRDAYFTAADRVEQGQFKGVVDYSRLVLSLAKAQAPALVTMMEHGYRFAGKFEFGSKALELFTEENEAVLKTSRARVNLKAYLQTTCEGESATVVNRLTRIIKNGFKDNLTVVQIAASIKNGALDYSHNSATTIARSATIWAYNEGSQVRYTVEGVTRNQWFVTEDDATCEFCRTLDGAVVKCGDEFVHAGATVEGDEGGAFTTTTEARHPPLHPRCRCALLPVVVQRRTATRPSRQAPAGAVQAPMTTEQQKYYELLKREFEKGTPPKRVVELVKKELGREVKPSAVSVLKSHWKKGTGPWKGGVVPVTPPVVKPLVVPKPVPVPEPVAVPVTPTATVTPAGVTPPAHDMPVQQAIQANEPELKKIRLALKVNPDFEALRVEVASSIDHYEAVNNRVEQARTFAIALHLPESEVVKKIADLTEQRRLLLERVQQAREAYREAQEAVSAQTALPAGGHAEAALKFDTKPVTRYRHGRKFNYTYSPERQAELSDASNRVARLVDKKVAPHLRAHMICAPEGMRAWEETGEGTGLQGLHRVLSPANASFNTVHHELGHVIEDLSPHVKTRVMEFLEYRGKGKKPVWLGPPFGKKEIGYRGVFKDDYCGKVYPKDWNATEVLSMGIQYLLNDPTKFAAEDPEYFDFMVGVLRGWL